MNHTYHRRLAVLEARMPKAPERGPALAPTDREARALMCALAMAKAERRFEDEAQLKLQFARRVHELYRQAGRLHEILRQEGGLP